MSPRRTLLVLFLLTGATIGMLLVIRRWLGPQAPTNLAAEGERVFWGRGRCAGCHPMNGEGGGSRCPDLGRSAEGRPFAERAGQRVPGIGAVEYVLQSLLEPDAYSVPGYPARLMPPSTEAPVALDEDDIRAVAVYLLAAGNEAWLDREAAVALERRRVGARRAPRPGVAAGDGARGRRVYQRMRCASCHEDARIGPVLGGIGAIQGAAYLEESIVSPDAVVVRGPGDRYVSADGHSSRMPSYEPLLSREELADLVAYLGSLR